MEKIRNRRFYALSFLVLALAGGVQAQANAACIQGDMTGTWHAIGTIGNSNLDGFEEYIRCKIVLNSAGTVVVSSSSCRGRDNVGLFTINVTGGSVRVGTTCAVIGSLTFYAGTTLRHTIEFGQMARTKTLFTFTSYQNTNPDILGLFTAVKQ